MEKIPNNSYELIQILDEMYSNNIMSLNIYDNEDLEKDIYMRIGQRKLIDMLLNMINQDEEE